MDKKKYKQLLKELGDSLTEEWFLKFLKINTVIYDSDLWVGIKNIKYEDTETFFIKRHEVSSLSELSWEEKDEMLLIASKMAFREFRVHKASDRTVSRFHFHLTEQSSKLKTKK